MRSTLISTKPFVLNCSWLASRCSQRSPFHQRFPWALQLKEQILKEQITDDCVFFKMPFRPCPLGCGRFLSADDGHDRCLQCLGIQHTEAAFVDDSCACCGRMNMTSLRSRLSFLKGLAPSAATRPGLSGSRGPPAGALGDLRVTVRASPPGSSPRTSYSSRSERPVPREGDVHYGGPRAPSLAQPGGDEGRRQSTLSRRSHHPGWAVLPSSSRQCRSRPRRSSTSCHGGVRRQRRLPLGPDLRLLVAVDALLRPPEPLHPVLKRKLGRRVEPLAGARRPPRPIRAPNRPGGRRSGPDAGNPEMLEFALSQETTRKASLLPPVEGRVENPMFPFISVPPLAQGSAAPTFSKKEQFPFPPGFQVHGPTVCDALPPHSRPRPILPAAKRARFGDAVPPHAPLASPLWDPGSSAWMLQNALPSVPSSSTPLRCTTTGTSIVPLEPLARRLEAWLALPSPSRWLTRTIRLGYAIQFARRPPKFSGVLETLGESSERSCLVRGDCCPPGKGCNRAGPSSRDEAGVLQPLLHRTQERWWSSTNPGFATPEPGPAQAPVQDADTQAYDQMHTAPGLVCSDRPEGCLLSCFDPSPTQTVPTVCVRRSGMAVQGPPLRALPLSPCLHEGRRGRPCPVTGSGRQDPQLSRRLAHSGPVPGTVVRSQGSGASAPQPVGASGQLGKEQALPCAENLFSWCGVRLGEYDGPPHGRARPVSAELPEFLRRQDCGPTETVSEAPGAYGIRSRGHAARITSYETTSALVTLPSPEVGMAPRCTSGEHHTGVSPLLQPLDRPCLSTGRGALRTSVSACCCHNGCLQHGLGRYMQRAGSLGSLDGASTALAHQLPRAAGSASSLAAVSATAVRQACVGPYGQHCGCVIYQPDGGYTITPHVTARPPSPPLESHVAQIAACCPHSRGAQSCGRRALTTAHFPRRMATPSRDDPADLESIRRSSGGPVCFSRVLPLPVVFLPDRGLPRHGRTGTQLASGSMQICISPSEPARTDTVQSQGGQGAGPAGRAVLAHPDLVSRTHSPRDSPSLAHSSEEGPPFSGARHHLAPASRPVEPPCVAPGRDAADLSDLPQAVVETITQARAPSTRQAYALKWSLFANWCSSRREDPRRCTIGVVLSFLQERLERRLSPSTLKVYVAAIAAHHDAVDGRSLGKHDLIVRFLRGARRLNPLGHP